MSYHKFDRLAGKFIVFEGLDGAGKGTQLGLLRKVLVADDQDVVVATDPGGTEIGWRIRKLLLDPQRPPTEPWTEALLFMASRAELWAKVIAPSMRAGKVVLGDRWFWSTMAYQGEQPGSSSLGIRQLAEDVICPESHSCVIPHLTLILDVPAWVARQRVGSERLDAIEKRDAGYHERVRAFYESLSTCMEDHTEPRIVIDGTRTILHVHDAVMVTIRDEMRTDVFD